MLSHCDDSAFTRTSFIPSADTATYSSTSSPRTRVAIRGDGQISTHDQNQEGERNVSFRASFLRSTIFCAPFRCDSNPDRLPATFCRIGTPGPTFQRAAFVSLRPHTTNSQPTLVFPPISGCDSMETGIVNTPADGVELLKPAHTISRVGCTGMLALLNSLIGRHEMA
jgi:hypothetical protein